MPPRSANQTSEQPTQTLPSAQSAAEQETAAPEQPIVHRPHTRLDISPEIWRHVILLDQDERGYLAYVDVETFGDPMTRSTYQTREVPGFPDVLEVEIDGEWKELSVERGPDARFQIVPAAPVTSETDDTGV